MASAILARELQLLAAVAMERPHSLRSPAASTSVRPLPSVNWNLCNTKNSYTGCNSKWRSRMPCKQANRGHVDPAGPFGDMTKTQSCRRLYIRIPHLQSFFKNLCCLWWLATGTCHGKLRRPLEKGALEQPHTVQEAREASHKCKKVEQPHTKAVSQ